MVEDKSRVGAGRDRLPRGGGRGGCRPAAYSISAPLRVSGVPSRIMSGWDQGRGSVAPSACEKSDRLVSTAIYTGGHS